MFSRTISVAFILMGSLIFCKNSVAQQQQQHEGVWLGGQVQIKFSNKWAWQHDAGFRTAGTTFLTQQYLYRTGARYFVHKNLSFVGGGAIFFSRSSLDQSNHEFGREWRLWQEAFHSVSLKKILWQNRFTTEQRFFEETNKKPGYTAYRFRIKTIFTKPVSEKWSLQLSDEYLRQAANRVFTFDQNRLMLYGLYNQNATTTFRTGYMWLLLPGRISRHILNVNYLKTLHVKQPKYKV